jgi:hypothetical protein
MTSSLRACGPYVTEWPTANATVTASQIKMVVRVLTSQKIGKTNSSEVTAPIKLPSASCLMPLDPNAACALEVLDTSTYLF